MNTKRRQSFIIALFFLLSLFVNAHGSVKKPPLPKPNEIPSPGELPIDGGISILFIIGAAYGVYAIRKRVKD